MANETVGQTAKANGGFGALWRFLPMLWPKGQTELKARVVVAVTLVLAFESVPGGAAAAAAGTLLAIGVIAISVGVNVPINKLVCEWAPDAPPANWAAVRARWTRFHAIRTNRSLVAFACSLAAAAIGG